MHVGFKQKKNIIFQGKRKWLWSKGFPFRLNNGLYHISVNQYNIIQMMTKANSLVERVCTHSIDKNTLPS